MSSILRILSNANNKLENDLFKTFQISGKFVTLYLLSPSLLHLGLVHVTLTCNIHTFLYKALVRCHFDYAASVWSPYLMKHIEAIENVQRRATKLIPCIKDLDYESRLRRLRLPTLAYRRVLGT